MTSKIKKSTILLIMRSSYEARESADPGACSGVTGFGGIDFEPGGLTLHDLHRGQRLPRVAYTLNQLGAEESEWLRRGGWSSKRDYERIEESDLRSLLLKGP